MWRPFARPGRIADRLSEVFQDEVAETIDRCAAVVGDLDALRDALHELRLSSDPRAQFATALFDLDRARRGDPEARGTMLQVADALLVFWREGTGEELAASHPELTRLWNEANALLVTFEEKRLSRLLKACWDARKDAALLEVAVANLQPDGYRRVEFARCLYHLELARLFVQSSRAEFAARAGLLAEAYQDEAVAQELIAGDAGLEHLWRELLPYLDEFFEHQERKAFLEKATKATSPALPPVVVRETVKTDPAQPAAEPVALGAEARPVPSFRTLVGGRLGTLPPPPLTPPSGSPPFESRDSGRSALPTERHIEAVDRSSLTTPKEPTLAVAPPPPPADFTPPGGWHRPADDGEVLLDAELDGPPPAPAAPPPPPRDLTPPGAWPPAKARSGEVELLEAVEALDAELEQQPPPPPPAMTPSHGVPMAEDIDVSEAEPEPEAEPDAATKDFWAHTFEVLQLAGGADGRTSQRLFATETRADRKRLVEYLDSLTPHLAVPEARAFGCLVRLLLAAQTKEKGLFGQANPVRQEAVTAALSMLAATPEAAGRAAVWFELDGPETRETLSKGLEVVARYLAWCSRGQVDPLDPGAPKRFATGG